MRTLSRPRRLFAVGAATLAVLATASAADAANVTVAGDDGNPVALAQNTPVGIRNMSTKLGVGFAPGTDTRYSVSFAGPDGVAVATSVDCFTTKVPVDRSVDYRGNGTYTFTVTNYAKADTNCAKATSTETYPVVIAGSVVVGTPAGKHLIRAANSYTTNTLQLPVQLNPGASSYEIRYAAGGVIGPDGAISGPSETTYVSTATGLAPFSVRTPGRYVVVARAVGFAGGGRFYTPWSAPVAIDAIVPFDLQGVSFPDSRGPSYELKGTLRETSIRGRVTVSIARGKKGGKYRTLGRVKISSKGTFRKRFSARKAGVYRLRYVYKGSSTAAAGKIVQQVRITRRLAFR